MCKFVVLLNKPITFLKFSLPSPLSLLKLPANCFGPPYTTDHWTFISIDYTYCSPTMPQKQTNWWHHQTQCLLQDFIQNKKTKEQRNWSTTFYTNTTIHTSPNLQRHTVTQLNSTHFSSHIHIRDLPFIRGGGLVQCFFPGEFFFCPSPISCKKNYNPSPCMAQKSYVPPHAKRYDRDY